MSMCQQGIFFVPVLDGVEEAKKLFHATVPLISVICTNWSSFFKQKECGKFVVGAQQNMSSLFLLFG